MRAPDPAAPTGTAAALPPGADACAALLARAFHDDPMMAWVEPDRARRPRALAVLFAANARHARTCGRIDAAPDGSGAALWLPPGAFPMTLWRLLRSRHALLPLSLGLPAWRRLARVNAYAVMQHARTVEGPHWYLHAVGVDPARRRRGVATSLLVPALERADLDRLPCYLETASEATLPLYERLGFRVAIPGRVPPDGPPLWSMLRPGRR